MFSETGSLLQMEIQLPSQPIYEFFKKIGVFIKCLAYEKTQSFFFQ